LDSELGADGYKVIKFKLRRIEGQPPLSGSNKKDRQDRMLKIGKRGSRG